MDSEPEQQVSESQIIPLMRKLLEGNAYKVVLSTIDQARPVHEIAHLNEMPQSSAYKQVKKLEKIGLLFNERIETSHSGKKIIFYRSNVNAIKFQIIGGILSLSINKVH